MSRRDLLRASALGLAGLSMSGWLETLAADTAADPARKRSCILLWMNGGPSQMDTFDLKPGHANGGPYKEISTAAPGLRISEHLPRLAAFGEHLAVVRSLTTKEGDHGRAGYLMRTGRLPQGPIQYPTLGSLVSKELGSPQAELPNFVSVSPYRFFNPAAYGPGFLGPLHAPLIVGEAGAVFVPQGQQDNYEQSLKVQDLDLPADVTAAQADARVGLLHDLERDFAAGRSGISPASRRTAYDRAVRLMKSEAAQAFQLDKEPDAVRDRYGRNRFGHSCLLARRLVERGVPFVEVTLGGLGNQALGWDTHVNNFENVKNLSTVLDGAWAALMGDLKSRGLLETTTIVWMGEFGRTPKINGGNGRDHYPNAWSAVLAGGGINGGQAIGSTSADGTTVTERPVTVEDLLATLCIALGVDPHKSNMSNVGRPIRIVEPGAKPILEALAS
jgi:hypothetical protein